MRFKHDMVDFVVWYYGKGMSHFGNNATFKKIENEHKGFHDLINNSLDCALSGGCMNKNKNKEKMIDELKQAEEHSNKLMDLLDALADEVGQNIDMKEVLA